MSSELETLKIERDAWRDAALKLAEALREFNRKYSPGDDWNPFMREALAEFEKFKKEME